MSSTLDRPRHRRSTLDPETSRVAASAAAAAAIAWWPAFTLATYGVIFFEQQLALWAVTTGVFIVAVVTDPRATLRSPQRMALLLPSLWLLLAWLLPPDAQGGAAASLSWFGVVVTLLGIPLMASVMIRLLVPSAGALRPRQGAVAAAAVLVVMCIAFLAGKQHARLFTCEDFTISGNFAPADCTPGPASPRP